MAKVSQDGIKEKVASVREVVPGPSNNEIHLVLQYYDYDVEKAIQAYLEDGAKEALQEWHYPGNKVTSKKKKKNKPKKQQAEAKAAPPEAPKGAPTETKTDDKSEQPPVLINGHISEPVGTSAAALPQNTESDKPKPDEMIPPSSKTDDAKVPSNRSNQAVRPKHISVGKESAHSGHAAARAHHGHTRERTISEVSTSSSVSMDNHKKPYGGIERSLKDLQRQRTSLKTHSKKLKDEVDKAYKDIASTFEKLHKELNEREVALILEMDKVKTHAQDTINARQDLGDDLKQRTYRASTMTEQELAKLRLEIKGFVSDRKIDEDLGSTTRFKCEFAEFVKHLKAFGQVVPVKGTYNQRHPSVSSMSSSVVSPEDLQSPLTPSPMTPSAPQNVFPPTPPDSAPPSKPLMSLDLKSDSLSTQELAELQQRLQDSLKLQGLPVSSRPAKRNVAPRSANTTAPDRNPTRTNKDKNTAANYDSSDEAKKSRNARRRQKQRERQKEQRTNGQDSSGAKDSNKETQRPASVPAKNSKSDSSKPSDTSSIRKDQQSYPKLSSSPARAQGRPDQRKRPPRKSSESPSKRSGSAPRGDQPAGSRSPRRNRPGPGGDKKVAQENDKKIPEAGKPFSSNNETKDEKDQLSSKGSQTVKNADEKQTKTLNGPSTVGLVKEEVKGTQTDPILNGDAEPYLHGVDTNSSTNNNNNKIDKQRNDIVTVSVKESMKEKPVTVSVRDVQEDALPQRRPRPPRRGKLEPLETDFMNGNVAHGEMNGIIE